MSATLNVQQSWTDGKRLHVVGVISLSGNYTVGGISLSLVNLAPNSLPIPTTQPIVFSDVVGKGGYYAYDVGTLYQYRYQDAPFSYGPGNSPPNQFLNQGSLRIFLGSTELSAGALPAGVLSDVIKFYGIFQKT
jgi:hypothetical protein